MTGEPRDDYFLFVGSTTDSESATSRLRAGGGLYRKKLLASGPDNWIKIAEMISAKENRGTVMTLTAHDYSAICDPRYAVAGREILEALTGRPHVVFVHEEVFLTDDQRAQAHEGASAKNRVVLTDLRDLKSQFWEDVDDGLYSRGSFGTVSDEVRDKVNALLRDLQIDVVPYKTNLERSVVAGGFIDDHERHLLFRFYVPNGRLYAQEAETLLGLFREWLGQTGRAGIRQEGYTTAIGQVFEFFSARGEMEGGLAQSFEDFSSFLESCMSSPDLAARQLELAGVDEAAASLVVGRFATRARRIRLDLRQRREERVLILKHQFENVMLESDGVKGAELAALLDEMIPEPGMVQIMRPPVAEVPTVNNYNPQFFNQVSGQVIQNVAGTVNLGAEARQILQLVDEFGGNFRSQLETAVHELEDEDARGTERFAARGRLVRFLADLGNRGVGVGLDVLQKYVEHKVGVS